MRSYRPLKPSTDSADPSGPGSASHDASQGAPKRSQLPKKRQTISLACNPCQKRKSKCDGKRPTCSACQGKSTACVFDDKGDLRRITNLRTINTELLEELDGFKQVVLRLKSSSKAETEDLLRKLREDDGSGATALLDSVDESSERRSGDSEMDIIAETSGDDAVVARVRDPNESPMDTDQEEYSRHTTADRQGWHPSLQIMPKDALKQSLTPPLAFILESVMQPDESSDQRTMRDAGISGSGYVGRTHGGESGPGLSTRRSSESMPGRDEAAALRPPSRSSRGGSRRLNPVQGAPGYVELYGSLPVLSTLGQPPMGTTGQMKQTKNIRISEHLLQPLLMSEDSPLSRVYTDYRDAARRLLAGGASPSEIIGQDRIDITVFFRERRPSDAYSASSFACELWKSFECFEIFERLAGSVLLANLMRWMLDSSPERYGRIPAIMRPTRAQVFMPHSPSIDLVVLPPIRDALIHKFRDWVTALCEGGISCNWPHDLEACYQVNPATGRVLVTPRFEAHVSDAGNWTFNESIFGFFPELKGDLQIRDE